MSKLEDLIQELCPDGVEYKALKEVSEIKRGVRVTKRQLASKGEYPVYQNSLIPLGYSEKFNCLGSNPFLICAGAAGDVGYSLGNFWAADDCFWFNCSKFLNSRYLYHVLLKNHSYFLSKVRKASIPRLPRISIENLLIPIPPLEIQEEIVRILDAFTQLIHELTNELTARKQQYEYYRDRLLTFDKSVRWKTLGEVCFLKAGKNISSSKISSQKNDRYSVPCFGGNGIRGYVETFNQHGEASLIGRQGALCGNVWFVSGNYYATEHAVVVTNLGDFNNRFLYHILNYMNLNQYKSAGAQPGLSVEKLKTIKIPVPSLEEQEGIVAILDRFDALCNDLTSGLPAEIEARQKQYEYYRDKLLSFKELKDE